MSDDDSDVKNETPEPHRDPARKSRILSERDQQLQRERTDAEWRGQVTQLLEHIAKGLDEHIREDRETFKELRKERHESANRVTASFGEVWDALNEKERRTSFRVGKLDSRITFYLGGVMGLGLLLNLAIGAIAAYAAWK